MENIFNSATITKATLSLYHYEKSDVNAGNTQIKGAVLTSEWDENAVTWFDATSSSEWGWGGGDYEQTWVTTANYDPSDTQVWHDFSIIDVVQDWIDNPSDNHGIVLLIDMFKSEFIYKSTESSDLSLSPKLSVSYDGTGIKGKSIAQPNGKLHVNRSQKTVHFVTTDAGNYEISWYNAMGKMIKTTMIKKDSEIVIPFSSISKGMHLLRIYNKKEQKQEVFKCVLNN